MAKSRNRKDKKNKKGKLEQAQLTAGASEKTAAGKNSVSHEPKNLSTSANIKVEKKAEGISGVHVSTCIAGMFLTLCLGLYLGSLLPDLVTDVRKGTTTAPAAPVSAKMDAFGGKPAKPAPNLIPETAPEESPKLAISPNLQQHIRHLEDEAAQYPRNAKILADLGNAYFDTGQTTRAIAAYEKSLAIDPANPDVLTDLGIMYREEKNYDVALDCFKKAATINPKHLNALFNQGVVLGLDQHRHAEAKEVWQKVLELSPEARAPDGKKVSDLILQMDRQQHD